MAHATRLTVGLALEPEKKKGLKPVSNDRKQSLQDTFLNAVRKARTPLTIFLVNGVKLQGGSELV